MPQALQVITAFVQGATGGGFEDLTPGTGDSFTFQNVPQQTEAYLAEVWGVDDASPFELSLKASRFHDQQFGIRMSGPDGSTLAPASRSVSLLPDGFSQPIFPSDVLIPTVSATAKDNVNVSFVLYYADLPGIAARLARYEWVKSQTKNLVGINVPLTSGAGDWGTGAALNSADDRLHANTDYAVVGFTSDVPLAAVALFGVDTGNMKVGGPVLADAQHDASLFSDYARCFDAALVPVVNSNNAGAIILQAAAVSSVSANIDVQLVELKSIFPG